ncbi:MAG: M48 family metallopeptidase [Smithella sp.]|nr:M48 family metallopeptidase [Smithella sp.]MDM7986778.1 M48 family metallopeptidase [Smithella sp.]HOU50313.1 M48 family metallopeptidase [Smithella sp.]HQG64251.1 M48 family metallopeptidase [Smithella sp.]HQH16975.1 M48 family metallopeptidase [Smithella sp.]
MEKSLLIIFLILFLGRIFWRFFLQQINIRHLREQGKVIPPVFYGVIDEATLAKMVDYTYDNSRLETKEDLTEDILELAIVFLLLPVLVGIIAGLQYHIIWQALIFFGILALIGGVVGMPFDIYHTFVLEKKYGFSTITWKLWLTDLLKSVMISAVLMGILLSAFMAFILYLPKSWWFWAWIFFTVFEILLLWLFPVVIAPLFNKYEPIKDEVLKEKITALLAKVGLKAKGIFQVDEGKRSKHTNAYFTGIGKTKRIVLFDTLLASHSQEEILAVLAHEIGHWKKKHIMKQLIFMIAASFVGFYLVYLLVNWPPLYGAFGLQQTPVYAGLLMVSIYFSCIGFFFSPLGALISRRYEREADKMATELVGTSEPMINALKRLAKDNLSNLHPHPWYVWFYYSHPPLLERIEYLKAMDKEMNHN